MSDAMFMRMLEVIVVKGSGTAIGQPPCSNYIRVIPLTYFVRVSLSQVCAFENSWMCLRTLLNRKSICCYMPTFTNTFIKRYSKLIEVELAKVKWHFEQLIM